MHYFTNKTGTNEILVTEPDEYGWILASNCFINVTVTNGILLKIGLESQTDKTNNLKINSIQLPEGRREVVQLYQNSDIEVIGDMRLHYVTYEA